MDAVSGHSRGPTEPNSPSFGQAGRVGQHDVDTARHAMDNAGGRRVTQVDPPGDRQLWDDVQLPQLLVEVAAYEGGH
eukprot:11772651-Heterocapsa_arctica.AAC.1